MTIQKVAVLGLQGVGAGIAESLIRAQYHLTAWSPKQVETSRLEQQGARMVTDLGDAMRDAQAVLVWRDGQTDRETLEQAVSHLKDGQILVLLTSGSQLTVPERDQRAFLTVQVSGSEDDAAEGRLRLNVQKGEVPEAVQPILDVVGEFASETSRSS